MRSIFGTSDFGVTPPFQPEVEHPHRGDVLPTPADDVNINCARSFLYIVYLFTKKMESNLWLQNQCHPICSCQGCKNGFYLVIAPRKGSSHLLYRSKSVIWDTAGKILEIQLHLVTLGATKFSLFVSLLNIAQCFTMKVVKMDSYFIRHFEVETQGGNRREE